MTLVCQDWGGITGLTVVKDSPHFFARLVIMNTALPVGISFKPATLFQVHNFTPFLTWRTFVQLFEMYLPIKRVFKFAFGDASSDVS